jgi:DNA polymerase bacteriophage-type
MHISIDFETFSEADLKKVGAWKYSEHPSAEVLCLAYALDNGEPYIWFPPTNVPPLMLFEAIKNGATIDAHNVGFERAIWENVCVKRMGWPAIEPHQLDCTMARAASRALPLGLDDAARALGLDAKKDKRGRQLIQLLCKPQKPKKKDPRTRIQDPELLAELYEYCKQDVRVEQELRRMLGNLPPGERSVFLHNEKMNSRGVTIDVESVHNALAIVDEVEHRLTEELVDLTFGEVKTHNEVAAVLRWLHSRGVHLDDLTADTVTEAIPATEKGSDERRVLEIRKSLAKASTKKLASLLAATGADGRVRGLSQYHGAFTGRNAGRLVQPLNLPRPKYAASPEQLIQDISHRSASYLEAIYGDAMQAVADALRPMFMAGPGKLLCAGDLRSIEAVGLAALAGEETKLDVFRRGEKPYEAAGAMVFGRPINKYLDPKEYTIGKICELAFGYGGSVGAWRNFDTSEDHSDDDINGYKKAWRSKHPRIATPPWEIEPGEEDQLGFWYQLEDAAIATVMTGEEHTVGPLRYVMRGQWLVCVLPSGRSIGYYDPRCQEVEKFGRQVVELTYMSQKKGRWQRVSTWGGKLAENVTQAACRDILIHGTQRCDDFMPAVMTVYDEIITEVDEDMDRPVERLIEYMVEELPAWCASWPIGAEGWVGKRYRKE